MARTPQYLEELLAEIKPHVHEGFWKKRIRTARARAGGKASPRKVKEPSLYERVAFASVTTEALGKVSDENLLKMHQRCHDLEG